MNKEYLHWIQSLKNRIRSAQLKASIAVNEQMILLYWDIGEDLYEKQQSQEWGTKVVENLAKDLKRELPDTNGFSRANLFAMCWFHSFYKDSVFANQLTQRTARQLEKETIVHQAAELLRISKLTQIPWRHHVLIVSRCSDVKELEDELKKTRF